MFIPLAIAVVAFLLGSIVCFAMSASFPIDSTMFLIVLCLAAILGLCGVLLTVYLLFEFAIYQDIEVKCLQTMMFNQKRQLGTTTDNWKRGKRMKVHVSNID